MRELSDFPNRHFERVEVRNLEIRGRGNTGYWLFEVTATETLPIRTRQVRFVVRFIPSARKYLRVFSVNAPEHLTVPAPVAEGFEAFVKEEYRKRGGREYRMKGQGPVFLLNQLSTLLLTHDPEPEEQTSAELRAIIEAHFKDRPDLVARCKSEAKQYYFGDDFTGKFFLTETLPVVQN